tara:strand:+ start:1170 stop:3746 length:2577 start_codon:yes stop_codon:yes gene_type:complete
MSWYNPLSWPGDLYDSVTGIVTDDSDVTVETDSRGGAVQGEGSSDFQRQLLRDAYFAAYAATEQIQDLSVMKNNVGIVMVDRYEGFSPMTVTSGVAKSHKFVDLPDKYRRFLIPYVNVYKTYIRDNEDSTQELTFRIDTDPNKNGVNRVELENVDYVRLGGNPAEVDTNINFNITISAREIGFLFERQYPKSEEGTEDPWSTSRQERGVAWIDLIKIDPGQDLETSGYERVVNERNTRMKVDIGYSVPAEAPFGMDADDWALWGSVIHAQRESFFLSLKSHQFDFKASGEISLSVNFVASATAAALSSGSDLLNDPPLKQMMVGVQERIRGSKSSKKKLEQVLALIEQGKHRDAQQRLSEITGFQVSDSNASKMKQTIEDCIAAGDEIEEVDQERVDKYYRTVKTRILNQLYGAFGARDGDGNRVDHRTRWTRLKASFTNVLPGEDSPSTPSYGNVQERSQFLNVRTSDRDFTSDGDMAEITTTSIGEGDNLPRYYTSLGDIIESALEIVADNLRYGATTSPNTGASSYVSMPDSPSRLIMPFSKSSSQGKRLAMMSKMFGCVFMSKVEYNNPDDISEKMEFPLRDLPISLDLFRSWWLESVKDRRTWYLKDFIAALMSDFVKNYVFSPNRYDEIDRDDVTYPSFIINTAQFDEEASLEHFVARDKLWHPDKWRDVFVWSTNRSKNTPMSPLVIIQQSAVPERATDSEPRFLWGQSTRGVMEKVQFKREDIPGFAEARLFSGGSGLANNIMLREKYNVDIELLGTTVFKPGSIFRLDPNPLDLGFEDNDGKSRAKSLGLGGRYCVHSVEHRIDLIKKEWMTKIIGKWTSFSDGEETGGAGHGKVNTRYIACLFRDLGF